MKLKILCCGRGWERDIVDSLISVLPLCYKIELSRARYWNKDGERYDCTRMCIIEKEDETFQCIDFGDACSIDRSRCRHLVKHPLCTRVLKCQFRSGFYDNPPFDKILPWVYTPKYFLQPSVLDSLRSTQKVNSSMHWRGLMHSNRAKTVELLSGKVSNDFKRINYNDYLQEIASHFLVLSLPGWGSFCHREFEGFSVGTAVISPILKNQTVVPLLPNVHYIAVDCDPRNQSPVYCAEKITERYNEVMGDLDFISYISQNGAKWYDENAKLDKISVFTAKMLGF